MSEFPKAHLGVAVKFIGGRYNGFHGTIMKACDQFCSVFIRQDGAPGGGSEVVEEKIFLKALTPETETPSS